MSPRAFSLAETVIALGLLSAGFLLFFRLFQTSLSYSNRVDQQTLAASIASRHLARLRSWAAGTNFDNMAAYPDANLPDPDHPEFQVQVQTQPFRLDSPNSTLTQGSPQVKSMTASAYKVQVTVSWRGVAAQQFRLTSLVCDPTRQLRSANPLVITGPPATLARDQTLGLSVQAYDTANRLIPDLSYTWYVEAGSGNGSISQVQDGTSATFTNAVKLGSGTVLHTGGSCQVRVRAVYRGQEAWATSGTISLL